MTTCFYFTTTDLVVVVVRFLCNFYTAYNYNIVADLKILKLKWTKSSQFLYAKYTLGIEKLALFCTSHTHLSPVT